MVCWCFWKQQDVPLTCFILKLLICKRVSSRKLRVLVLRLSDRAGCLGALGLCEGDRAGGLGEEDSEGGRGEEDRDSGFGDEDKESGLGDVEETDGGLGEGDELRGLGEEESERALGEDDTRGTGDASARDWETSAMGLALAASPVAWMTLRCSLGVEVVSSPPLLEPEKRRAGGWGSPGRA